MTLLPPPIYSVLLDTRRNDFVKHYKMSAKVLTFVEAQKIHGWARINSWPKMTHYSKNAQFGACKDPPHTSHTPRAMPNK